MLTSAVCVNLSVLLAQAAQQAPATGDTKYVVYGLIAIAAAIVIFLIELFVPSGGLLAVAAVCALVLGIVLLSLHNTTLGLVTGLIALLAAPFFFAIAIRIWPQTPIGRLLTHRDAQSPLTREALGVENPADMPELPAGSDNQALIGHVGRAATDLRPVGMCIIDGQRVECLAESGVVRAGIAVKVVAVDGMQIKVRAAE